MLQQVALKLFWVSGSGFSLCVWVWNKRRERKVNFNRWREKKKETKVNYKMDGGIDGSIEEALS